ncbi:MAG TPA: hypothetical protein VEW42_06695, partial [Candidatus Eisenbacteria bacterium]|nr:hypothetical protein [Candidatus Eisenbacteria bacterium]
MKILSGIIILFAAICIIVFSAGKVLAQTTSLGGMDLDAWCAHINEGGAKLVNNTTWVCTGNNQPIDFVSQPTPNCVWQYNVSDAFAQQTRSGDPYSWACFTNGVTPTPTNTPTPTLTPTPTPTSSIAKLQVINTDTQGIVIDPFTNGSTINVNTNPHININAITNPSRVGSVVFILDGKIHTENVFPYDDPGDADGAFKPFSQTPSVGSHTLTVTPYSQSNGSGTPGAALKITFNVVNTAVSPTPTPPPATDDWTTFRYDRERSNFDPSNTSITTSTVPNLKLNWSTSPGGTLSAFGPNTISAQPAVVQNVIYYGDWTGNFYAKNVSNGSIVWQRNIGADTPGNGCSPTTIGVASSATVKTITVNGVDTSI